jgi:hypothetical protein
MNAIQVDFFWISGLMLGVELLYKGDIPDETITGGIVFDIGILRIMVVIKRVEIQKD